MILALFRLETLMVYKHSEIKEHFLRISTYEVIRQIY